MGTFKTELTEVIYDAAAQAFQAKVTVHHGGMPVTYACAITAPITMSFQDAARGLAKQALRKHGAPTGLRSFISQVVTRPAMRTSPERARRGLPVGQYGFFRGRAA